MNRSRICCLFIAALVLSISCSLFEDCFDDNTIPPEQRLSFEVAQWNYPVSGDTSDNELEVNLVVTNEGELEVDIISIDYYVTYDLSSLPYVQNQFLTPSPELSLPGGISNTFTDYVPLPVGSVITDIVILEVSFDISL